MNKDFLTRISSAQGELKAPKNQYNSFGKYSYRSCEDILEAAKPVCAKYGLLLTVSDEIMHEGDRYYIKATACLYDAQGGSGEVVSATAFAREALDKKGMDDSQITGTASSYARKYALNGLFCIDDTKDADTMSARLPQKPARMPATEGSTTDTQDNTNPGTKKSAKKIAQKSPTAAQPEPEYKCAECGKPFTAFPERNLTAKQVYETCMNLSGGKRALCKACREKSNLQ